MGSNRRLVPLDIVEEIMLNLSVKSVRRFSTVSKSWNSIVSEPGFIKRYRGREMMGLVSSSSDPLSPSSLSSFSSVSSLAAADETKLVSQLKASCDELWCIEIEDALFLYNPSTKACRNLPNPHIRYPHTSGFEGFVFGLGYDAVGDDYKLLKSPHRNFMSHELELKSELYSLRNDSWRKISSSPHEMYSMSPDQYFFNGMLHSTYSMKCLNRLDLSTEKYAESVPVPEEYQSKSRPFESGMGVLRGKLCVFFNAGDFIHPGPEFYLVEIDEEYSWTLKLYIDCRYQTIPNIPENFKNNHYMLRPLHLYDNGDILFNFYIFTERKSVMILMYKKKENIFVDASCNGLIRDGVVFVQTLVLL